MSIQEYLFNEFFLILGIRDERGDFMIVKSIKLENFRNYDHLEIDFSEGINIIYGNNAQGKTNLLESIYVLALTKSHRSFIDQNLLKNGTDFSRIEGIVKKNNIETKMGITISKGKKKCYMDMNEIKKMSDYISNMNIIIFYPEDLELIKGSPLIRRRYLNLELSQLDRNYFKVLNDYNRLLKMRNDYLKKIDQNYFNSFYFSSLTDCMIDKAVSIYFMRNRYISKINNICTAIFKDISGLDGFRIEYCSGLDLGLYDKESLKIFLKKKMQDHRDLEFRIRSTVVGPHKDDISFFIGDLNIKNYGSQGQQRMAILAMKLAEFKIFERYCDSSPILLLDDVFSELDDVKKNNLLSYISQNIQTIITTTELTNIDSQILAHSRKIEIENGHIKNIIEVI